MRQADRHAHDSQRRVTRTSLGTSAGIPLLAVMTTTTTRRRAKNERAMMHHHHPAGCDPAPPPRLVMKARARRSLRRHHTPACIITRTPRRRMSRGRSSQRGRCPCQPEERRQFASVRALAAVAAAVRSVRLAPRYLRLLAHRGGDVARWRGVRLSLCLSKSAARLHVQRRGQVSMDLGHEDGHAQLHCTPQQTPCDVATSGSTTRARVSSTTCGSGKRTRPTATRAASTAVQLARRRTARNGVASARAAVSKGAAGSGRQRTQLTQGRRA
jgi:hypothetical protein